MILRKLIISVIFSYNGANYNKEIILRNPEFGNNQQLDQFMVNVESLGLDRIIYRDPMWPETNTFNLTFKSLTEKQKSDMLEFLFMTTGASIFYRDHETRLWNGVILNPNAEVSQDHNCNWSFSINFLGILFAE